MVADGPSNEIYYEYWLIGAALVAQFVSVGVTNYVGGPFMTPMTEDLGWTRAEFTVPRSLGVSAWLSQAFSSAHGSIPLGGRPFMIVAIANLAAAGLIMTIKPPPKLKPTRDLRTAP